MPNRSIRKGLRLSRQEKVQFAILALLMVLVLVIAMVFGARSGA